LSADPDLNVKNGAQLLDRLLKDIITESDSFDIEKFIPLLKVCNTKSSIKSNKDKKN